jgi:hypothetical protein
VADGGGLENRYGVTPIVGSNPTPSALWMPARTLTRTGDVGAFRFRSAGDLPMSRGEEADVNQSQHDDVRQLPGGVAHLSEGQQEPVSANPVVHHVAVYKTRARMLDESRVEREARKLQSASSYDDWDGLTDDDRELWRHMARLQLL